MRKCYKDNKQKVVVEENLVGGGCLLIYNDQNQVRMSGEVIDKLRPKGREGAHM